MRNSRNKINKRLSNVRNQDSCPCLSFVRSLLNIGGRLLLAITKDPPWFWTILSRLPCVPHKKVLLNTSIVIMDQMKNCFPGPFSFHGPNNCKCIFLFPIWSWKIILVCRSRKTTLFSQVAYSFVQFFFSISSNNYSDTIVVPVIELTLTVLKIMVRTLLINHWIIIFTRFSIILNISRYSHQGVVDEYTPYCIGDIFWFSLLFFNVTVIFT